MHFVGRAERGVLGRQPSDRLWQPRQDDQAVEHPCPVQVHHPRRRTHGLGFVRALLAQQQQPRHRFMRLGQHGQGKLPHF